LSTVCLLLIIQRQWVDSVRLSFPVAQIPLDMVQQPGAAGALVPAALWVVVPAA
jgi:hypothetical protein